jgi:hypothetical protein
MKKVDALREQVEQWQKDSDRLNASQWEAHRHVHELEKEAVEKALESNNKRLEGMNELRAQIATERGNYVPREAFDEKNSAFDERLKSLEKGGAFDAGRIAMLGSIIVVGIAVIGIMIHFLGGK